MSERGKRVFRFLLDPERDAGVIGRIEAQPSMTGYVRELVRRDMHDERLDFAALKASELQAENAKLRKELESVGTAAYLYGRDDLKAENAKLRELVRDIADHIKYDDGFGIDRGWMLDRLRELGIEEIKED